ncbi:MAG TPA: hypothetical protein VJ917_05325 [Saprospiraceae bacterium]|nr:hypothetical protein [Saprospiraceae bacterium]
MGAIVIHSNSSILEKIKELVSDSGGSIIELSDETLEDLILGLEMQKAETKELVSKENILKILKENHESSV